MLRFSETLLLCITLHTPVFWKHVVERLTLGDNPYFTFITPEGTLWLAEDTTIPLDLNLIDRLNDYWYAGRSVFTNHWTDWKDIKKQTTKNNLLWSYSQGRPLAASNKSLFLLGLHMGISHKAISADSIIFSRNLSIQHIFWEPNQLSLSDGCCTESASETESDDE